MEPFLCGMTYSFILGLNIHQFNTDAGAASSSKCVNLPNHFLSQFVLKNAINPASIVPNQILPVQWKSKPTAISFPVIEICAKLKVEPKEEPVFPPMH